MLLKIARVLVGSLLVSLVACAAPASQVEPTSTPEAAGTAFEGTIDGVESLLDGSLLERYRGLPADYREALAAYLAFGVSPDLMPALVEQKMAQWPEEPEPLIELLGPEGYERFRRLHEQGGSARYYAFFLLTVYVYGQATDATFEGRRQAVADLFDIFDPFKEVDSVEEPLTQSLPPVGPPVDTGSPPNVRPQPGEVKWPPMVSMLTPAALAKLEELGPNFQRSVESFFGDDGQGEYRHPGLCGLCNAIGDGLLKSTAGLELPAIGEHLSEEQIVELRALSQVVRETVEPAYHRKLVLAATGLALYRSVTTIELPSENVSRSRAETELERAMVKDRARPDERALTEHSAPETDGSAGVRIQDAIDQETRQLYSELSPDGQVLMKQMAERIMDTAPPNVWEAQIAGYAQTIHKQEEEQSLE